MTGGKSRSRLDSRKLGNKEVIAKALTQMKEGEGVEWSIQSGVAVALRDRGKQCSTSSLGRTEEETK